ncbi:MAG: hypothetical protein R6V01_04725 [Thermoplasmatota archaeon]
MPRWDVHISFGLMAFVTVLSGMVLGAEGNISPAKVPEVLLAFGPVLLLGGGALLLGSVFPDLDGRGNIRWAIGPAVGSMLILPSLHGYLSTWSIREGIGYLRAEGSLIFLLGTAVSYSSLIVPKRHRGALHTMRAGILFGILWGAYVLIFSVLSLESCFLIGAMGSLGYLWHLALDGEFP